MQIRTLTRTLTAALAAGLVGACGGTQAQYPGAEDDAVIVVDNTRTTQADLTVRLVPEEGVRERLGTVSLSEEKSFRVDNVQWGSRFQLVAENAAGEELRSRPFTLTQGTILTWDLDLNTVNIGTQAEASPLIK